MIASARLDWRTREKVPEEEALFGSSSGKRESMGTGSSLIRGFSDGNGKKGGSREKRAKCQH
jgi:hypothetical protein